MKTAIHLFFLCAVSVSAAHAMDAMPTYGPDLTSARAKVKAKDWPAAIAELRDLSNAHQSADIYSLLAFSIRNSGDYETARGLYDKALALDPNHRGALEYSGELYLKTGEADKAQYNLQRLESLCPQGCEELADLREAFQDASAAQGAKPKPALP